MSLASLVSLLNERFGPQGMKNAFFLAQVGVGGLFLAVFWKLRSGSIRQNSGFSVREADLRKAQAARGAGPDLANSRIERKTPLQLEGIRINGTPHEILGVRIGATQEEIQKAYRERMKQYHPDKVGRPGSREWSDAQKIAEAINLAKNELLRRARPRS